MPDRRPSPRRQQPHKRRREPARRRERKDRERRPFHLTDDITRELRATARPGKGDILVKVFADAAAAFAEGDYGEAIRLGEQAKHIALRSVVSRELLGLAYYRAGKWKEAARELSAFRRISGSTEQNPVIADCYRATGKPEKSLEYCDEIREGDVDAAIYYEAQIVGAGALADMNRLDDAIERLEALELSPDVAEEHHLRAWYALGDLLERRGRFTQARKWFEGVEATDPDLTDASERAARLRGESGAG